jgi:signal peptidase II
MDSGARRATAFVTALAVFGLDYWSKSRVETSLGASDTKIVIPGFFNIIRSGNPGVAFGILADHSTHSRTLLLIAASIAAALILISMLWRIDRHDRLTATGLSLILGGALGNLFDRVREGSVTDFLDFYSGSHHWYTFNLADSAICIGAGLLILSMLLSRQHKEAHA